MSSLYHKINKYKSDRKANSLIFILSHMPVAEFFFHEDLVSEYTAKEGISMAVNSLSYFMTLTKKIIYVTIISGLVPEEKFCTVFVLMSIVGAVFKRIIDFTINEYEMIMLFKVDSRRYVHQQINTFLIRDGIMMFVALLLLYRPFGVILFYTFIYISIHLIAEGIKIAVIEHSGYELPKSWITLAVAAIPGAILGLCLWFDFMIQEKPLFYTVPVIALCDVLVYIYLYKYPNYKRMHKYNLTIERINGGAKALDQFKEKPKLREGKSRKNMGTGYKFLNRIFLERYRSEFAGSFLIAPAAAIIAGLAFIIAPMFLKDLAPTILQTVYNKLSLLFYIMYLAAQSYQRYIKLNFMEIDRYMINYSFYRNRESIMINLKLRLKNILLMGAPASLIIALALGIGFTLNGHGRFTPLMIIIAVILPIVLHLFFSIYTVASYYLLQPYSFDGTSASKVYNAINYIMYLIVYFIFMTDEIVFSWKLLLVITSILAVVSAALFVLVIKLAPDNFRVRG
ncbi:MAG: hypothetical protein IJM15_07580 [Erysipelotrichaceae bacterium]|nr:hypothetical protein [Erysipelotrichaceae bacterium]